MMTYDDIIYIVDEIPDRANFVHTADAYNVFTIIYPLNADTHQRGLEVII